ncbi:unnamed protein product [Peniophora sp. CBMAI 1063]|nr:unnamed protein product [Peniophora sp. CBMAI 1063]
MPTLSALSPSFPSLVSLAASLSHHVPDLSHAVRSGANHTSHFLARRASEHPSPGQIIAGGILIPVLVLLSGLFAGLTLGYMSLDETQLHVLRISGTPEQRKYAEQIEPIRKNGHLLLVTLLLANMVSNETLPIIADPVLGGGAQSVVVSTVLIVIFAEIIPQSVCTRHGLYIGAKMAPFMRILLCTFGLVAWPVAKLLEYILGPHHGIMYRRAELKELIALHANVGQLGGDLRTDTVNIIGATLDLQEKTARQAMTPIDKVFMLSVNAKLDYATLRHICLTGHSRIPVYEEIELTGMDGQPAKTKKIIGILLVKQCVLLDPEDAIPVRKIPLNKVVTVAQNEPLLGILDRFQEGRSHMAIVSRLSIEKAASVKKVVKRGLTQRIKSSVGISDSSDEDTDSDVEEAEHTDTRVTARKASMASSGSGTSTTAIGTEFTREDTGSSNASGDAKGTGRKSIFGRKRRKDKKRARIADPEMGDPRVSSSGKAEGDPVPMDDMASKAKKPSLAQSVFALGKEQSMPADAVLSADAAKDFLQGFDQSVAPLGIITLEDVLEELIGEEIYDEFDPEGAGHGAPSSYIPPKSPVHSLTQRASAPDLKSAAADDVVPLKITVPAPVVAVSSSRASGSMTPLLRPLKNLTFLTSRSRSAPPVPRDGPPSAVPVVGDVKEDEEVNEKPSECAAPMSKRDFASDEDKEDVQSPVRGPTPEVVINLPPTEDTAPAAPIAPVPRVAAVQSHSAANSRAGSPAPIEAILLDRSRSRRPANALAGNVTPRSATPSRGARFKSGPLGVVVAEQLRMTSASGTVPKPSRGDSAAERIQGGEKAGENIREPKDKEGPDKPSEV